jgi:hypothetical protein
MSCLQRAGEDQSVGKRLDWVETAPLCGVRPGSPITSVADAARVESRHRNRIRPPLSSSRCALSRIMYEILCIETRRGS